VRIEALPYANGGAQRSDLREREIDENHAAFDDVQPEVGVDSRNDERGRDRRKQELKESSSPCRPYFPAVRLRAAIIMLTS
jgi:hypothetical protein